MSPPVFVALTAQGLALARRLQPVFPGAEIHGRRGRAEGADRLFDDTAAALRARFAEGRPIVGLCAAGILIRALAPQLADKRSEPPVIALAEDGGAVVPLLGGHRGANDLARRIAEALGIEAAVTTAGDRRFGIALDAPPPGWALANPDDCKAFVAALLGGARVRLTVDPPVQPMGLALRQAQDEAENGRDKAENPGLMLSLSKYGIDWLVGSELPFDEDGALEILITERAEAGNAERLVYHPRTLALGVGCERGCAAGELIDLVGSRLQEAGIAAGAVAGVFSLDLKADEPAVHALAEDLDLPARFFDAAVLQAETPRLATPSEAVFREVGVHGVAEGAALAAVGEAGVLILPKAKSARATCALGRAPSPLDAESLGAPQGRLLVIGTGPGAQAWRTPETQAAVAAASDLVGYRLYLDLLGPAAAGKARHDFELGEEEARVRHALALAAEGRTVALVSSGDPGIYAMASLVFEVLEACERPDWRRVRVEVAPGISALQAAAARIGAPIGHDFCTVSLSDLMTPWPAIEKRLRAAAEGDFVVALYNPVSRRRRQQLERARDILLEHRPPDTPVVLAQRLGRAGEEVTVVDLAALTPEQVDMLTLVLIGSSATRRVPRRDGGLWVYTPRGYGAGLALQREARRVRAAQDEAEETSSC
ncbi:MAG: precorrin-3B C(17)-methyltransferase [Kiloniellales bacterium]|nr:precorrin-3B C(17)-methyltransferase [Kiloniellales bacterium]